MSYGGKGGESVPDFEEVYRLYFKDVYKYALSLCRNESTAEEITQETFFKALRHLDEFRGECRLYVWLCQIAKNVWLNLCRSAKHIAPEAEIDLAVSHDFPEDALVTKEEAFAVHRILHGLEEPYKEVFSLRVFGELSYRQIGELFGKTENWARVTYYRGKLKIREKLEEETKWKKE